MKKGKMKLWVLVLGMALIIGASISVSVPREVRASQPCCTITTIDMKTGIVTAKNLTTGATFEFKLGNAAQLKGIKVGEQVSTDLQTGKVTVHSFQPVDGILLKASALPPDGLH